MIKSTPLVSVIVPIYNVGEYLEQCLDSIKNQTYANIEILMVCGISNDNSAEIAKEYENSDSRFKYFFRENKGLADARNVGIDNCTGEYIIFIDSDDWIELSAIEDMLIIAETENSQVVLGKYIAETENLSGSVCNESLDEKIFLTKNADLIIQHLSQIKFSCAVWQFFFRAKFIKENNFIFDIVKYAEDAAWTPRVLCAAESISVYPQSFYHYRIRKGSLFNEINIKVVIDLLSSVFKLNQFGRQLTDKIKIDYINKLAFLHLVRSITQYYELKKADRKKIKKIISENRKIILQVTAHKKLIRLYVAIVGVTFGIYSSYKIYKIFGK